MLKTRSAPESPRPPTSAEIVASIRAEMAQAQAAIGDSDVAYDNARRAMDITPSPPAQQALEAAAQAARVARRRVDGLRNHLKDAEYRNSPEYAQHWREIEAAMLDRAKTAKRIQDLAPELHSLWLAWRASNEFIRAKNLIQDEVGGCFGMQDTVAMFRLELFRAGFDWAAKIGLLDKSDIKPMAERVIAANQHIQNGRRP